jgi:hypothetical protein
VITDPPRKTYKETSAFVVETLRKWGFRVHPGSRLGCMARILSREGEIDSSDSDFLVALEAVRDAQFMAFTLAELGEPADRSMLRMRLARTVDDPPLPQDRLDSQGRDAQFELYVGAICHRAGLEPEFDEPDVVCTIPQPIAIAVKRIKSLSALEGHVSRGAQQIVNSKIPGVLAIDITLALNPTNTPLWNTSNDSEFYRQRREYFRQLKPSLEKKMTRWVATTWVRGVILMDNQVRHSGSIGWLLDGYTSPIGTVRSRPNKDAEFGRFYERFCAGMPYSPLESI